MSFPISVRSWTSRLRLAGVLAFLLLPVSAWAFFYSSEGIESWVVDAETEKPLAGVIVVAHWELRGGFEGGYPVNEVQITETVTDAKGRYYLPAWGPKLAVTGVARNGWPVILLFKPGYGYRGLTNELSADKMGYKSQWDKKTVKLEPFRGSSAEYAAQLYPLSAHLWIIGFEVGQHSGDYCGWKSFPRTLRALDELDPKFSAARATRRTVASMLKDNDRQIQEKGCGSVYEVLSRPER